MSHNFKLNKCSSFVALFLATTLVAANAHAESSIPSYEESVEHDYNEWVQVNEDYDNAVADSVIEAIAREEEEAFKDAWHQAVTDEFNSWVEAENEYNEAVASAHFRDNNSRNLVQNSLTVANLQAIALWRAEQNDVQKRLGDLHFSDEAHGLWLRTYGGEYKSHSNLPDFNGNFQALQLGYDQAISNRVRVGLAGGTMKTKSNFNHGNTDGHLHNLTAYATFEGDNNDYIDVVGKYSQIKNDISGSIENGRINGDYDTYGLGLSIEYGMRFDITPNFYILPQGELSYGRIAKKDSTIAFTDSTDTVTHHAVKNNKVDSLVGRIGADFGHKWEKGNVHARISVAHEFDGKVKNSFEWIDGVHNIEESGKTTILNLGLGGTYSINDACYVYTNVERSFSGKIRSEWRGDLGLRWNF